MNLSSSLIKVERNREIFQFLLAMFKQFQQGRQKLFCLYAEVGEVYLKKKTIFVFKIFQDLASVQHLEYLAKILEKILHS